MSRKRTSKPRKSATPIRPLDEQQLAQVAGGDLHQSNRLFDSQNSDVRLKKRIRKL